MKDISLVIMAAGMGSRFGGLKQATPISDEGYFIIDYSIYDAIKSGIKRVVFVIKKENLELMKETIGKRKFVMLFKSWMIFLHQKFLKIE